MIKEMQEYYSQRANDYDRSMGYEDPAKVALLQPVIDHIREALQDRTVLEIACGPGFWTRNICGAVKNIVATDVNEATLEEARKKEMPGEKVSLKIADAYDLKQLARKFDGVLAVDWFAHVPKSRMRGFLENLHDCLTEDAVVIFCDQLPGPHSLTALFDEEGNHLQERQLPDGTTHRVIKHFLTDDEIATIFAPYAANMEIRKFPESRRYAVSYTLGG